MYEKEEFPPLLPDGLHRTSFKEFERACVDNFPLSESRPKIIDGFREVIRRIVVTGIEGELWINGSFVTEKIDPKDIDFRVMIPARFYDAGTAPQQEVIEWLNRRDDEPRRLYRCDVAAEPVYPEGSPYRYLTDDMFAHFRHIYGRSVKSNEPKGIVVISLPEARQ